MDDCGDYSDEASCGEQTFKVLVIMASYSFGYQEHREQAPCSLYLPMHLHMCVYVCVCVCALFCFHFAMSCVGISIILFLQVD